MVVFYKIWKKYNEIELTKKKKLQQSKNEKSFTLPTAKGIYRNIITNMKTVRRAILFSWPHPSSRNSNQGVKTTYTHTLILTHELVRRPLPDYPV